MHKFFHFTHLKSTFFHFTHLFLQNPHISLSILHVYSNKIFISLPIQPSTHSHRPTPVSHQNPHNPPVTNPEKQTIKTNPATRSTHPESTQPNNTIQQPGIETNPATQSAQPTRNRRLTLSNKIDTSGGDGENEKQDRRLQRQAVTMAMAMARDIQPETH